MLPRNVNCEKGFAHEGSIRRIAQPSIRREAVDFEHALQCNRRMAYPPGTTHAPRHVNCEKASRVREPPAGQAFIDSATEKGFACEGSIAENCLASASMLQSRKF